MGSDTVTCAECGGCVRFADAVTMLLASEGVTPDTMACPECGGRGAPIKEVA